MNKSNLTRLASVLAGLMALGVTASTYAATTGAPFKVLTFLAIQHAYAEGLREIDFLGDAEPWKLEWTDSSRPHDWLFVFANTVRARLLHSLKFQVVPELKRWRA